MKSIRYAFISCLSLELHCSGPSYDGFADRHCRSSRELLKAEAQFTTLNPSLDSKSLGHVPNKRLKRAHISLSSSMKHPALTSTPSHVSSFPRCKRLTIVPTFSPCLFGWKTKQTDDREEEFLEISLFHTILVIPVLES